MKKILTILSKIFTFTKNLLAKVKESIGIYIRTFLYIDFSKRNLVEIFFPLAILGVILTSTYHPYIEPRRWVLLLFILWAVLALLGFFIPSIKETISFGYPGSRTLYIPILLEIKSKGGFIAGRKIKLVANVVNISKDVDSKQEFRDSFDEFSIVFFNSIQVPIKAGRFLEGKPEAGGVIVNINKCKGKATIIFNSPGKFKVRTIYRNKNNRQVQTDLINNPQIEQSITVSPPENYISLRNNQITYSLTLIILLLALLQTKII